MSTARSDDAREEQPQGQGQPPTEKASERAHEAMDVAAQKAKGLERKLRDEAQKVAERVEEGGAQVRDQFDETCASVESFIRERPVAAVGMGFAAGMFVAALLRC